jgi:hypothetical protein
MRKAPLKGGAFFVLWSDLFVQSDTYAVDRRDVLLQRLETL